jgi:hypothetical protein
MRVVTAITLLIFVAVYSDPGKVFPKASSNSTLKTETPVSEGYLTTSDGVRLFYRRIGRGKNTAICVHGGPGLNIASGCLDTDPLAQTRSILMYDQRGGGRSDLVGDPKMGCTPYVRQKVKTLPWPIGKAACFRLDRC